MNDLFGSDVSLSLVVATGIVTVLLASALAFATMKTGTGSSTKKSEEPKKEAPGPVDREKFPGGEITVLYGTQTGTAESFARLIEREGAEHGFFVHVIDMEDIQVEEMLDDRYKDKESGNARFFFITSTYGEGEPTDNTVDCVAKLREMANIEVIFEEKKDAEPVEEQKLAGIEYGVFGLGNREYEHYNAIGKFFDYAMERVGASRVVELGLGDDCQDLEGDFETWKDTKFWPTLKKLYIRDAAALNRLEAAPHEELPSCSYAIEVYSNPQDAVDTPLEKVHGSSRHYFSSEDCPISTIRELRSKDDPGSTVHIEIDVSKAGNIDYRTADNLGVLPVNQPAVVENVAHSLGYDLNKIFSLKAAEGHEWHGEPFPMPISVRECLTRYCDLTSAPRRSDLKRLSAYAQDPVDKKALLRMSSKDGKAEYREKITYAHFGLVDVLKMCPSISAPLEHFLSFCPLLQTRFYTISSSSVVHPKSIHLTVSVTEAARKDGTVFKGVCSSHLAGLKPGDTVRVFNRSSTFRLPKDTSIPVIMVGPGTGIAPFRGMLQERDHQKNVKKENVGTGVLYFGCKKRNLDYLYEDELASFRKSGALTTLHLAFSREQSEKVYVQNLLSKNAKDTWALIQQGAHIYVCGGVKMGNDVNDAFKHIASEEGNMAVEEAKEFISKLAKEGRYVQELWA
ncbi:NADPH--cytochrome P450 reductase (Fragments) [Seminavis robusta]|uniref:NADPH--hemoprotein reductase n=1 Tax=Seminavis robusta TaxID=568900 RepID=A0A9N8HPM9_9STRA|nr:NADPH--cytochrome P450 reductase (Fragments) [Seminavis robusta]